MTINENQASEIDVRITKHREKGADLQPGTSAYNEHVAGLENLYREKSSGVSTRPDRMAELDAKIKEHRTAGESLQRSTMAHDRWNDELDALYKEKASLLASRPKNEQPESLAKFEPGKKPLSQSAEQTQAQIEELGADIRNQYGVNALDGIAEHLIGEDAPFKDAAAIDEYVKRTGLDAVGQREALMMLAEINAMPIAEVETSHAEALLGVERSLRSIWGEKYNKNLTTVRQVAQAIFGSVERWDTYATRRGWTHNAEQQVRAVMLLHRLGRRAFRK